jgi:hypothetical protein
MMISNVIKPGHSIHDGLDSTIIQTKNVLRTINQLSK